MLRHNLHVYLRTERASRLRVVAKRYQEKATDVGDRGTLGVLEAGQCLREGRFADARRLYMNARRNCMAADRKDDAMRAAIGEARALLGLDDEASSLRVLALTDKRFRRFKNADAIGQRNLVMLLALFHRRAPRGNLIRAARVCERVTPCSDMTTRLDLHRAVFRAYARVGMTREALRVFLHFEDDVRWVIANLEDNVARTGFLLSVGYSEASGEAKILERQSARIGSVDAGTMSHR
jgi:hypothetical protein